MTEPYKFEGWCGLSPDSVHGNMKWQEFQPKPFTDDDVDIQVSHCGVCGSDIHTLRSGWGPTAYPCIVGHEIVGKAVRVGKKVSHIKEGDRVGVGAQAYSCLQPDCSFCADGNETHCPKKVDTYNGKYADGSTSYGGYATYNRTPSHFVIKIPDAIPSSDAAPMLCGGITVYKPLKTHGCGPGKTVGVVGLGGLGHFAVLFAKALGADKVVVISRSNTKKSDALAMGADDFIATAEPGWETAHEASLDLIISTVSSSEMPLEGYLKLLRFRGTFVQVGAPEDRLPAFHGFFLILKEIKVTGSNIGTPADIKDMLQFAAEKNLKPWIQERPLQDANQVVQDLEAGKPRYRYVLVK